MGQLKPLDLQAWRGLIRTQATLWKTLEVNLTRAHGLTLNAYDALLLLEEAQESGVRMNDLARAMNFTSGGMTRLADKLEEEGYVERVRCEADARGFELRLTPQGRHKLKRVHVTHLQDVREHFLNHLTEEEKTVLAGIWTRLLAGATPPQTP